MKNKCLIDNTDLEEELMFWLSFKDAIYFEGTYQKIYFEKRVNYFWSFYQAIIFPSSSNGEIFLICYNEIFLEERCG